MFYLVPLMLEKVGIILIAAFLLSQMKSFRQIVHDKQNLKAKVLLILLFGTFGVISNYTGVEIYHNTIQKTGWQSGISAESALANTRVLGVVIGGLHGGPFVGLGAGLLAGAHRFTLGGYTAIACSFSTILAGIISGYLGEKRRKSGKKISIKFAVVTGMVLELLQMLIILGFAKPFNLALDLVKLICIPMVLINGFGMMLFMFIVQLIKREELRTRVKQTDIVFKIAEQTLPYFRTGLNADSSNHIANIILNMTNADAVAITNTNLVLAHIGVGSDHHKPFLRPETSITKRVLETGEISVARTKEEIQCFDRNCHLQATIVIPLKVNKKVAGTLKLYYTDSEKLDQVQQQLASGLANLFSTQLALVEAERQAELLKDAEIKALHSQVHPHFLFNSLNTISALCRTDPNKARELLLELSLFFRGNIQGARHLVIPLEKEIENVKAYITLVKARFPNKFKIHFHVEPNVEKIMIPPFILQPFVENAINYGFPGRKQAGNIDIHIKAVENQLLILVEDNGEGIQKEKLQVLGNQVVDSPNGNGTAIFNINERLKGIYAGKAQLTIRSRENMGTKIYISLPYS